MLLGFKHRILSAIGAAMRFMCECGHLITDTTDFLPYKAYMISDIDWEDYWEAHEREALGKPLGSYQDPMRYEQSFYQCEECGRLYFDDPDDPSRFIAFVPENKVAMVTGPSEGDKWKGFLRGYFFGGHGHVCWHHATGEEYRDFDDYGELKAFFDAELERLQSEGAIRSAWINKDGEAAVFKWNLEEAEPVPAKHEVYLTEPERDALERFKAEHAECHRRYPRGPRGWDFSYEVLPGICGADDRDLKCTCLRCGASVESVDRKIVWHGASEPDCSEISDFSLRILDLLHERADHKVRSETISMPARYYDVSAAIGYVRGLVDAARLAEPDTPLVDIARQLFARLSDPRRPGSSPELRILIDNETDVSKFDWAIEEAFRDLIELLKARYPNVRPEWIDQPVKERKGSSREDLLEVARLANEMQREDRARREGTA